MLNDTYEAGERVQRQLISDSLNRKLQRKLDSLMRDLNKNCASRIENFLNGVIEFYKQMQALFPNLTEERFRQLWGDLFQITVITLAKARPYVPKPKGKLKTKKIEMPALTKDSFGRRTLDTFSDELLKIAQEESSDVAKDFVRRLRVAAKLDPIDEFNNSSKT